MIKDQVTIVPHDFSHRAVNTSQLSFSSRRSLVLRLHLEGDIYEGEASPLDGFGQDDYETAHRELLELDLAYFERLLASCRASSDSVRKAFEAARALSSPSARFAIETCVLRRIADERKMPLAALLAEQLGQANSLRDGLPTSVVLDPSHPDAQRHFEEALSLDLTTFKLKTGRDLETELSFARAIASVPGIRIRLDPNQAWSPYELERLTGESLPLDWVEDPTSNPSDWKEFASRLPLAIDEILVGEDVDGEILEKSGASVVILKPMAIGGFEVSLAWARCARELGLEVSVSHLFDGPIAFDATAELAFALQSERYAPGLGAHAGLEGWSNAPRTLHEGRLVLPKVDA